MLEISTLKSPVPSLIFNSHAWLHFKDLNITYCIVSSDQDLAFSEVLYTARVVVVGVANIPARLCRFSQHGTVYPCAVLVYVQHNIY